MNRADRSGCGCLLIAIGSPVALVGYLLSGMADIYGTDYWWQELIIYAVLLTGLGGVVWGVLLISRRPSGTRAGTTTNGARARRTAHLERVDRELRVGDRIFHDYHGDGVVTQVIEDGWVTIRFEDEAADARLSPKFSSLWWAD
ncbi:MAG: hypothetical protein ACRDPV_01720 [Gaiellaceae bacterium]